MNALARHTIRGLDQRVRELEARLAAAIEQGHALRDARDYADSKAAGYIDRSFLEDAS
ncbi:hypothetical protein [Streptomyces sp. NPDC050534]|uniref:hypothetical protein n=1 Tax=Streptomyces sp. NPDC050534 TaxID=3365625 RepID=UPI0037A87391